MRGSPSTLAAAAIAATGAAVLGVAHVVPSPDGLAALAWGNVLAEGVRPELGGPGLPVPHQVTVVVGAILALGGTAFSIDAYAALAGISWAALIYATARLAYAIARSAGAGRAAMAVAAAAAVVIAVKPTTVYLAAGAVVDVPHAALIVLAAALVVDRPDRSPVAPLVLLGIAGLIRPEAWALGAVYVLWLARAGLSGRDLQTAAALAIAPAVLWIGFDAVIAGDPLNTLNQTSGGGDGPQRSGGPAFNPLPSDGTATPSWLSGWADWTQDLLLVPGLLGTGLFALGLAGAAWALLSLRREGRRDAGPLVALAAVAVLGAALAAESAIGVAVEDRYALPAAALWAALGAGWLAAHTTRGTSGALVATALVIGGAWAEAPKQLKTDRGVLRAYELDGVQLDALDEVTRVGIVTDAVSRCGRIVVGGRGRQLTVMGRSLIAMRFDRDPSAVELTRAPRVKRGTSVFRLRLPRGGLPRVISRRWEFRSKCLPRAIADRRRP